MGTKTIDGDLIVTGSSAGIGKQVADNATAIAGIVPGTKLYTHTITLQTGYTLHAIGLSSTPVTNDSTFYVLNSSFIHVDKGGSLTVICFDKTAGGPILSSGVPMTIYFGNGTNADVQIGNIVDTVTPL